MVGTEWRPTSWTERILTPFTLRSAALVTCWSHNLERMVIDISKGRVRTTVLVGGVDRARFSPGPPSERLRALLGVPASAFVVFSPRLFWPRQNIDTILYAFKTLRSRRRDAILILVRYLADREPVYASRMDALASELGVASAIRYVSHIPNEEMPDYYRLADVTVSIPSTDGTPMSAMESLACGTPVVMSDLPDYDSAFFGEAAFLPRIDPRSPEALAHALVQLASESTLKERTRELGPRLVGRRADQEGEIDRLEAYYRQVLDRA